MFIFFLQQHIQQAGVAEEPKIVFIVPTQILVNQQLQTYQKYLPHVKIVGLYGDKVAGKPTLNQLLSTYTVFVITPQILVDAIGKQEIESLQCFSMLIFDECHHAMKSHPYNAIMKCYFQEKAVKEQERRLPQVFTF